MQNVYLRIDKITDLDALVSQKSYSIPNIL